MEKLNCLINISSGAFIQSLELNNLEIFLSQSYIYIEWLI